MDENKIVAILELILEENRDMRKGINFLVGEIEKNTDTIHLLVNENRDINKRLNGLSKVIIKHAEGTDKKFTQVNDSLEIIVNELSRLRADLKEIENAKIQKMEDRKTVIFRTGA